MKVKTTQKQVKNAFNNIISIGYCDAWYLLRHMEPTFYTCGVYGWNSDVYIIDDNTCIVTGYRPFGNLKLDNIRELNERARNYYDKNEYKKGKTYANRLLLKSIEKCLKDSRDKEESQF